MRKRKYYTGQQEDKISDGEAVKGDRQRHRESRRTKYQMGRQ